MSNTYRILSAIPVGDRTLEVTFSGGKTLAVDFSEPIDRLEAFAPLADPALFTTAQVVDYGWTLEWDNGASMAAERVYQRAQEQAGRAMPLAAFQRWMDSNGLSLTAAAEAIGVTRRTISQYRSGARPVPRTVALACIGWEALQQQPASLRTRPKATSRTVSV